MGDAVQAHTLMYICMCVCLSLFFCVCVFIVWNKIWQNNKENNIEN